MKIIRNVPPMRRLPALAATVVAATALMLVMPLDQGFAQGVVKNKYGDWQLRCETPPGAAREQCAPAAKRCGRGQAEHQSCCDHPEDGGRQEPASARDRAARHFAAVRSRAQSRRYGHRPGGIRALSAERLRRRSRDGRKAHRSTEERPKCHLHYFPDTGGRRRHSLGAPPGSRTGSRLCLNQGASPCFRSAEKLL